MNANLRDRCRCPVHPVFTWLAVVSLPATLLMADDWPRWMGAEGEGVWNDSGIIDSFGENGPEVCWRQPIGGGYSGPSIADGRVFITDRTDQGAGADVENDIRRRGEIAGGERVLCLDVETGERLWSHDYECPYTIAYPVGPRCTPAVDDDRVYSLGAMGDLICLKVEDGEVVWKKSLTGDYGVKPPPWGFASHPLVDGDRLLVPVGGEGSGVVAFDKMTGEEIWRAVTTRDVAYAPLVLREPDAEGGRRQLIFWHAEGVVSLDPETGTEFWTVKFPDEPNPSVTTIATPRFDGDRLLISEFYKGSLLLRVSSNPPAVEELWRSFNTDPRNETGLNSMMTTPVIRDGYVYGIAYNARGEGILRCIKLEDGEHQWTEENWMADKPLMFATAFIVENNGRYWMFNDNGELMIARLNPDGFEEIDRAPILEPTGVARGRKVVWSHPAFANGRMVARNDKEIVCIDLRAAADDDANNGD